MTCNAHPPAGPYANLSASMSPLNEAVLKKLNPADHASLREVSRSVCERTTAHIPYISLLLTDSTNLLQQWHQATRSLQHVNNIHVHVACNITAEVFGTAMQLLSQRTGVRELHLVAVADAVDHPICGKAGVHTLAPLQHILPSLQTLVIEGITLPDLLGDLKQLAAAAVTAQGWKLHRLTCYAQCYVIRKAPHGSNCPMSCGWSEYSRAILQLPIAFPHLQHLSWDVFVLKYELHDPAHLLALELSATGHSAAEGQQQDSELLTEEAAKCGVATALAHAVLQLKCLEAFTIGHIPDVWRVGTAAAAAAPIDPSGLSCLISPSAAAAAAAVTTLDDYSCWLLQHHPKLRHIRADNTAWAACGMSWHRKQQHQPCQCTTSICQAQNCCKAELADLDVSWWKHSNEDVNAANRSPSANAPEINNSDVSSHSVDCSQRAVRNFTQRLAHYTSRPASLLMKHINSCHLHIDHHQYDIGVLANLLSEMKSLKHLEVDMEIPTSCTLSTNVYTHASMALSAAAAVPGLQSLSLHFCRTFHIGAKVHLTNDLLLPLTAVAGGPGSSLTKLKLYGNFSSASKAAGDVTAVAAAEGATAADVASSVPGHAWYHALLQLDGLQELVIKNWNDQHLLCLPVECLPAELQVLEGESLCIMSIAAATDGFGESSSNACRKPLPCIVQATHKAAFTSGCPNLQTLTLSCCHLSSPSILASNQVQKLTLCNSSWSGGWAAAAASWPNVKQMVWKRPLTDSSSTSVAVSECSIETLASATRLAAMNSKLLTTLWDVFDVFRCLNSLCLVYPPADQKFVNRCQAELQQAQQSGRAYVWHSITSRKLLVRCSSMRNMSLSRRPQYNLSQLKAVGMKKAGIMVVLVAILAATILSLY